MEGETEYLIALNNLLGLFERSRRASHQPRWLPLQLILGVRGRLLDGGSLGLMGAVWAVAQMRPPLEP